MASALLSHHRTDVNGPGMHGMTPLMYAAQAGHDRMAVLLLRLRSDRYRCNDKVRRVSRSGRESRGFFIVLVTSLFFHLFSFRFSFFIVFFLSFSLSTFAVALSSSLL